MTNLTMKYLVNNFEYAKDSGVKYVGVAIAMQGFEKPEIIINAKENFDTKLDYYQKAYNNDLTLKTFNGIRIVGFTYRDTFEEIEEDFIEFK